MPKTSRNKEHEEWQRTYGPIDKAINAKLEPLRRECFPRITEALHELIDEFRQKNADSVVGFDDPTLQGFTDGQHAFRFAATPDDNYLVQHVVDQFVLYLRLDLPRTGDDIIVKR